MDSLKCKLMSYALNGAYLMFLWKNTLSIKKDIALSNEFATSELFKELVDVTSFLPNDVDVCLRIKAVMQDIYDKMTCPICHNDAHLNKSTKLSIPLYSSTCNSTRCKMSYMSKNRKFTQVNRNKHSIAMTRHKQCLCNAYKNCIEHFIANKFNLVAYEDVKEHCSALLSNQTRNGALIPQHEWHDNVDMLCSIIYYTQFILFNTHITSVVDLNMIERIYCIAHGIKSKKKCKFCQNDVKFISSKQGYVESCARCKGEKYRTTRGCRTFKDLISQVEDAGYKVIQVKEKAKGEKSNSIAIRCKKCGFITNINIYNMKSIFDYVYKHKLCKNCEKYVSSIEIDIRNLVESIVGKENVIINDRNLIFPYELDIVVPKAKVAIEFNGLYWHNINVVDKGYHLNKTIQCENKGYSLMHIWEDEWENNKDYICNMIVDMLCHKDEVFKKYALDVHKIDRSKISKLLIPKNYKIEELLPAIVRRKKFDVENCGYLIYKKL